MNHKDPYETSSDKNFLPSQTFPFGTSPFHLYGWTNISQGFFCFFFVAQFVAVFWWLRIFFDEMFSRTVSPQRHVLLEFICHRSLNGEYKNQVVPLKINILNPTMKVWKMIFVFKQLIFRFHIDFPRCILHNHTNHTPFIVPLWSLDDDGSHPIPLGEVWSPFLDHYTPRKLTKGAFQKEAGSSSNHYFSGV